MGITLVSFPRSGRNWVCTLLDVYNGGPVFNNRLNNPDNPDVGCSNFLGTYNHDHNANKPISGRVLYIYRNPIDVIFSMLNSNNVWVKKDKKLKNQDERIRAWAKRWKNHTRKWRDGVQPDCTDKLVIKYENLATNLVDTLELICKWIWLNETVSKFRCEAAVNAVSKDFVKKICKEDNAIVAFDSKDKKTFRQQYGKIISSLTGG
jgi:hypothetical protein